VNLTSPSQVKAWCIENDFHPNKVMGQNFLVDRNQLVAIVDAGLEGISPAGECLNVLEIGPGLGVLTEELLGRGAKVLAVEKDRRLAERLKPSLGDNDRLEVVCADALDVEFDRPFDCMVSNLPYQAGTRILLELALKRSLPAMTVLVQSEVADRLAAKEGSKTRSLAGVWAQLDYDVKVVRKVSASCFWPRPEIGSSVVRLSRHDRNIGVSAEERDIFHRLTKKAFEHRRKQLGSIFKDLIQSTARAEELTNEDWLELSKGLLNNENT
jgi:16S rRNA (adenine1518-N6/adenine1519-N6)-dimethyltransferase